MKPTVKLCRPPYLTHVGSYSQEFRSCAATIKRFLGWRFWFLGTVWHDNSRFNRATQTTLHKQTTSSSSGCVGKCYIAPSPCTFFWFVSFFTHIVTSVCIMIMLISGCIRQLLTVKICSVTDYSITDWLCMNYWLCMSICCGIINDANPTPH